MVARREKGQSLFEFILFLPILITLYAFMVNIGGSINGSINQQKTVRGYFFARIKNNSTFPIPNENGDRAGSWSRFGMHFIGWRERWADGGQVPLTNCYVVPLPLGKNDGDECNKWSETTTQYIRPRSVFGICGATYVMGASGLPERHTQVSDVGSCLLQ